MDSNDDAVTLDSALQSLAVEARDLLGLPYDPNACHNATANWCPRWPTPPTPLQFAQHLVRHVPILIDGCLNDRPCLQQWKWDEYLIARMGDRTVQVALTPDGQADDVRLHEGREVFALPMEKAMTFQQLFNLLQSQVRSDEVDTIAYLQSQNSNLTGGEEGGSGDLSPLLHELRLIPGAKNMPPTGSYAWADEALDCAPEAVNLWIGTAKSRTSMHRDHYENLFTVIRGTKIFTLYPPCEAYALCEDAPYDVYQWSRDAGGGWVLKSADTPPTPWIPIDPTENSDSERNRCYPRFQQALPPLVVEVNEGETLFLPAGWFHHVAQRGDEIGICIAVNWWYDSQTAFGDRWALESFVKQVGRIAQRQNGSP